MLQGNVASQPAYSNRFRIFMIIIIQAEWPTAPRPPDLEAFTV